jgi:hypothetical protein
MEQEKKFPRGRPPKNKNVLLKSTMEPIKEEKLPDEPKAEPKAESKVEPKAESKVEPKAEPKVEPIPEIEVPMKEKKPRTEKQIEATKRMIEAKSKRKITIIDSKPEKPEPIQGKEINVYDMLKQMEDKIAQLSQKKPKKEIVKPKKIQHETSSESEESDDDYVEKYTEKAEKRFQAVQAIEQRLQQAKKPKGRYDHLTLF